MIRGNPNQPGMPFNCLPFIKDGFPSERPKSRTTEGLGEHESNLDSTRKILGRWPRQVGSLWPPQGYWDGDEKFTTPFQHKKNHNLICGNDLSASLLRIGSADSCSWTMAMIIDTCGSTDTVSVSQSLSASSVIQIWCLGWGTKKHVPSPSTSLTSPLKNGPWQIHSWLWLEIYSPSVLLSLTKREDSPIGAMGYTKIYQEPK